MDELDLGATIRGFSPGQKIFGRYTLRSLLGRGGMGVVWRARDESLERDVAIKMLPEIVANDPVAVRELKRETIRSQQLNHPHILRIYDFAEGGGLCGITMEIVAGGTLSARRLEQSGEVFAVETLGPLVKQLCAALEYAHTDAQIVHRDLKPTNLMLDAAGRVKVMDFGIAASLSESVSRASNHASTSGSPGYMSPQQWRGLDPTPSDDIYALGATLYELLCGQPPFKSPQPASLMHQVLHERAVPLNDRRAKIGQLPVPKTWEDTIMALLAKEPKDRPQNVAEVAESLRSVPKAPPSASEMPPVFTKAVEPELKVESSPPTAITSGMVDDSLIEVTQDKAATHLQKRSRLLPLLVVPFVFGAFVYFNYYAPAKEQQLAAQAQMRQEQEDREKKIAEFTNSGVQKLAKGNLDGAVADYNTAIALNPRDDQLYRLRADAKTQKGDLDGAIADYDGAVALDPKNSSNYLLRGHVKQAKGDLNGAIADYDRLVALDPNNSAAYTKRGSAKLEKGDLDGAIADSDQAIARNPKADMAYAFRGVVKQAKGDLAGAIADFDHAIALYPQYSEAYALRAIARRKAGDKAGAEADEKVVENLKLKTR